MELPIVIKNPEHQIPQYLKRLDIAVDELDIQIANASSGGTWGDEYFEIKAMEISADGYIVLFNDMGYVKFPMTEQIENWIEANLD